MPINPDDIPLTGWRHLTDQYIWRAFLALHAHLLDSEWWCTGQVGIRSGWLETPSPTRWNGTSRRAEFGSGSCRI